MQSSCSSGPLPSSSTSSSVRKASGLSSSSSASPLAASRPCLAVSLPLSFFLPQQPGHVDVLGLLAERDK